MNWPTVLENISVFAITSGLLVWLMKSLVGHSLSRDLETFKAQLQKMHEVEMEHFKNRFTVGATSHMADIAFDKHVQFCEEYTAEVYRALQFLFKRGPHADVLQNASALRDLRTKWSVWLIPEIESQLEKFESALQNIGANAWLLEQLRADENRGNAVRDAFRAFAEVMGWAEWRGEALTRDVAAEKVIEGLKAVLGISALTRLRTELIERATQTAS